MPTKKTRGGRAQSHAETQLWRATTPQQKKYWSEMVKQQKGGAWKDTAKKAAIGAAAFSALQLAPLALHVMINGTKPTAQLYPSNRQRGWGLFGDIAGNVTQAKNGWDSLSDYQKNGTIAALKDFPLDKFLKNADRAFSN